MTANQLLLPFFALALGFARADITYLDATHGVTGNTFATGSTPD